MLGAYRYRLVLSIFYEVYLFCCCLYDYGTSTLEDQNETVNRKDCSSVCVSSQIKTTNTIILQENHKTINYNKKISHTMNKYYMNLT